jgi:hypothetical protein
MDDFMETLKSWQRSEWFLGQHAEWMNRDVEFQKVFASLGFCFNVNMDKNVYRREM